MTDPARRRELGGALAAALSENAAAERRQRHVRGTRNGNGRPSDGARPLEFDESGFPVPQRNPSFVERVARLLSPL